MDTHQQKISHLKSLLHLASLDGDISKVETVYIKNVAERLGVHPDELLDFDGTSTKFIQYFTASPLLS